MVMVSEIPYFFFDKMFATSAIGTLGNGQSYSNPEVDKLLAEALVVTDQNERAEIYKQALKLITKDNPGVFYGNPLENMGMTKSTGFQSAFRWSNQVIHRRRERLGGSISTVNDGRKMA